MHRAFWPRKRPKKLNDSMCHLQPSILSDISASTLSNRLFPTNWTVTSSYLLSFGSRRCVLFNRLHTNCPNMKSNLNRSHHEIPLLLAPQLFPISFLFLVKALQEFIFHHLCWLCHLILRASICNFGVEN